MEKREQYQKKAKKIEGVKKEKGVGERRGREEEEKRRENWENNSCEAKLYFLFGNINTALLFLIGPSRVFWLPYACVLRPDINCPSTTIRTTMPLLIGIALLYVIDIAVIPLIIETDECVCLAVNSQRPAPDAIVGCY
jgi:hypothetical protein